MVLFVLTMTIVSILPFGKESDTTSDKIEKNTVSSKDTGYRVSRVIETITIVGDTLSTTTNTYAFGYDDRDRLITKTVKKGKGDPKITSFNYEGDNKVVNKLGTEYQLGDRGEVKKIVYSKNLVVFFTYKDDHTLLQIKQGTMTIDFIHNEQNQRTKREVFIWPDGDATDKSKCTLSTKNIYTYDGDIDAGILYDISGFNYYSMYNGTFLIPLVSERVDTDYRFGKTITMKYEYEVDSKKRVTKWTEKSYGKTGDLLKTTVRVYTWMDK